jgi:hypothetical protein
MVASAPIPATKPYIPSSPPKVVVHTRLQKIIVCVVIVGVDPIKLEPPALKRDALSMNLVLLRL